MVGRNGLHLFVLVESSLDNLHAMYFAILAAYFFCDKHLHIRKIILMEVV